MTEKNRIHSAAYLGAEFDVDVTSLVFTSPIPSEQMSGRWHIPDPVQDMHPSWLPKRTNTNGVQS